MAGRTLPFAVCRTYGPLEAPPQRNFIITSGEKVRLLITVYERDGDTTPLNTSGMAAYFSFGDGRGYSRDGTFLSFESGQFYFDMMGVTTRDGRGQIPWRVTLGDSSEASVVAFGVINVMAAYGHRFSSTNDIIGCALTTSDGYYLDTGSGIIVVPCPGDGGGGGVGVAGCGVAGVAGGPGGRWGWRGAAARARRPWVRRGGAAVEAAGARVW